MIALFNEHIRDYWSILENESIEWGIWPGLLSVLQQEFIFVITITLTVTLVFWLIRRIIFKKPPFLEAIGTFVLEQIISLLGASVAAVIGAFLVGSSFMFGVLFHSPISLDIGRIIEIVASALLIFALFETIFFFFIDLEDAFNQGVIAFFSALPLSWLLLWLAVNTFSLEVTFDSKQPLPEDFQLYSYTFDKALVTTDSDSNGEGDIYVIDHVSEPGERSISSKEYGERFWSRITPDNYYSMSDGNILVPRTIYFAGQDIVPNESMNGFFHKRPDLIELDWKHRSVELTYQLNIAKRAPSNSTTYTSKQIQEWEKFDPLWYEKTVSGPPNGGWGITVKGKGKIASYTVLTTSPPKLITIDNKQNHYERDLPESEPIKKITWHRQYDTVSLWINDKPTYYMSDMNPTGFKLENNEQKLLQFNSRDFVDN